MVDRRKTSERYKSYLQDRGSIIKNHGIKFLVRVTKEFQKDRATAACYQLCDFWNIIRNSFPLDNLGLTSRLKVLIYHYENLSLNSVPVMWEIIFISYRDRVPI